MSKKKSVSFEYRSRAVHQKTKHLLFGAVIGLLIGSVSVFIAMDTQRNPGREIVSQYHPATYTIAEKFMCGCPECELELVKCKCDHLAGGKQKLGFISKKLKRGLSETEVVNDVYEQFGNIKPTYLNLLKSKGETMFGLFKKKVRNPVCNMEVVPEKAAAHSEYQGQIYYFCAQGVR